MIERKRLGGLSLIFVFVVFLSLSSVYAENMKYEYYYGGFIPDSLSFPINKYSQSFTVGAVGPNEDFILKKIAIHYGGYEGNPGILTFGVYTSNENDEPVTKLSENTNVVMATPGWYNISLPDYGLLRDTKYAIVWSVDSGDLNNRHYFIEKTEGCTYPGGKALLWTGSSWTWHDAGICFNFEVYGPPQICYQNSDCGQDGWVRDTYCFSNDVLQVYRSYTCNNPGTPEASCSYTDNLQLKQDCGEDYLEEWGANYCKDDDVYHSRNFHDLGCFNGICFDNINIEEEKVEECLYGCRDNICIPSINLNLQIGWNLVSIPFEVDNPARDVVFPPFIVEAVWEYVNLGAQQGYSVPFTIEPKKGYWVKAIQDNVITIIGMRPEDDTVQVNPGWNLIGVVGNQSYPTEPFVQAIWEYNNPGGYVVSSQLEEGRGFWVKSNATGILFSETASEIIYSKKDYGDIPNIPEGKKKKNK